MLVRAKLFLRQAAPSYYRLALLPYVKARRFTQRWRRVAVYANQRANGNIFAIELDITAGFFAVITAYLYILVHCETHNLTPYIRVTGRNYRSPSHDRNWINNYFNVITPMTSEQRAKIDNGEPKVTKVKSINDLGYHKKYKDILTIEFAHHLMKKHLTIKDDILMEVDDFFNNTLSRGHTLGVHYRGTDKFVDAPRLSYDILFESITNYLRDNPQTTQVLLATDEPALIEYMKEHPLAKPLFNWASSQIFPGGVAPHYAKDADKYILGREALLTCLALARCDYCIRTASYLSGFASVLNPALRSVMLNPIYHDRFPDWQLWNRQRGGAQQCGNFEQVATVGA